MCRRVEGRTEQEMQEIGDDRGACPSHTHVPVTRRCRRRLGRSNDVVAMHKCMGVTREADRFMTVYIPTFTSRPQS